MICFLHSDIDSFVSCINLKLKMPFIDIAIKGEACRIDLLVFSHGSAALTFGSP